MRAPARQAGISSSAAAGSPGTAIECAVRSGASTSRFSIASRAASIRGHGSRARIVAASK